MESCEGDGKILISCSYTLPEDVLFEILYWLPVEALFRFKSVCKSWYKLIKNPTFIAKHFELKSPLKVGSLSFYMDGRVISATLAPDSSENISRTGITTRQTYYRLNWWKVKIPCHINGLFLVLHNDILGENCYRMALWNPATRMFNRLPDFVSDSCVLQHVIGLGLDPSTGNYKVVAVGPVYNAQGLDKRASLCVYTVGQSKSWRLTNVDLRDDFNVSLFVSSVPGKCLYLKGNHYWLSSSGNDLLSLDMETEQLHFFKTPFHKQSGAVWSRLSVHSSGSLALFGMSSHKIHRSINIWLMKQPWSWSTGTSVDHSLCVPSFVGSEPRLFVTDPLGSGYPIVSLNFTESMYSVDAIETENLNTEAIFERFCA